ncbi:hypothetical protein V6N13_083510 [Hibiscus sabdariffa]|uniref:Uncharacterized protein n=1 Tax=Hibiscus sabdariffa TaxID=183260 RepID=A0ABR2SY94_9ROSI
MMSLAFGRNNDNSSSIRRSGFLHGMQYISSVYGSPEERSEDRRRLSSTVEVDDDDLGSCSSSSIGRNMMIPVNHNRIMMTHRRLKCKASRKDLWSPWMLSRRFCR